MCENGRGEVAAVVGECQIDVADFGLDYGESVFGCYEMVVFVASFLDGKCGTVRLRHARKSSARWLGKACGRDCEQHTCGKDCGQSSVEFLCHLMFGWVMNGDKKRRNLVKNYESTKLLESNCAEF